VSRLILPAGTLSTSASLGAPAAFSCHCSAKIVRGDPTFTGGSLFGNWGSAGNYNWGFELTSPNVLTLSIIDTIGNGHGVSVEGACYGKWFSAGATFSASAMAVYCNRRRAVGPGFALIGTTSPTLVGGRNDGLRPLNGFISHAAAWTAELTAEEMGALDRGVSPLSIRPASLWGYWPLYGPNDLFDFSGHGRSLTVGGKVIPSPESPFPVKLTNYRSTKLFATPGTINAPFFADTDALYMPDFASAPIGTIIGQTGAISLA
jgi:hypothetical protein